MPNIALSASGLTFESDRGSIAAGGVLRMGKWRFVQLHIVIKATLGANDYWQLMSGFDAPLTPTALSASAYAKAGGAISAYLRSGTLSLETGTTALSNNDEIMISGWYIAK